MRIEVNIEASYNDFLFDVPPKNFFCILAGIATKKFAERKLI